MNQLGLVSDGRQTLAMAGSYLVGVQKTKVVEREIISSISGSSSGSCPLLFPFTPAP